MSAKIYTIHHGLDAQLVSMKKYFSPIQVGCANTDLNLGILRDNKNGVLSEKNKYFCELTAMDEIASSITSEKYIGVMHYRRVFSLPTPTRFAIQSLKFYKKVARNHFRTRMQDIIELHHSRKIYSRGTLERTLSDLARYIDSHEGDIDIIVPTAARIGGLTIREHYAKVHHVSHYDLFLERLGYFNPKLRPYISAQERKMRAYFFNMFIMRTDLFIDYWSILKETLLSIEKEVNAERLEGYQSRVFGFLAERYMNIFVDYSIAEHGARTKELPVAMCDLSLSA